MACPTVSIVVLCHSRLEYTDATLRALLEVPCGVEREIIIVDNGSDAPTGALLRAYYDRGAIDKLVQVPRNLGTSAGYNLGFAVADAGAHFLTKLDNDIVVKTPGWLAEICAIFADVPQTGIVSTEIENHGSVTALPLLEVGGHPLRSWQGWVAGGGGMTVPRTLYTQLGGFSTAFPAELLLMPDDLEFYHRVHRAGYGAYYACAARSHHQTHLDAAYETYRDFKDRQYHLLSTRFFGTARTNAGYAPWFVKAEISSARADPGDVLQLAAQINASSAGSAGIGMSVRAGAESSWIHDPTGDRLVTLQAGTHSYKRAFRLPLDVPAGTYDVSVGLYEDMPGSIAHDHLVLPAALQILPSRPPEPRPRRGQKGRGTTAARRRPA